MSAKFFSGTELFMYECMMQQTPNISRFGKNEKKMKTQYIGCLKEFMREHGYGEVIKRVLKILDKFLFDEFIFLSEEHRDLFWRMYKKWLKNNAKKDFGKMAVIYLLSTHRTFEVILANYVSNPLYTLPKMYKGGEGEEKYNIYHAAKMFAGTDSRFDEADIFEDDVISDKVLCLVINAKFIEKYGINGYKDKGKKSKPKYVNNSIKHRHNKVFTYNGQTVRIK